MTYEQAIEMIKKQQAQRICSPGKWVVWIDGGQVKHKRMNGAE